MGREKMEYLQFAVSLLGPVSLACFALFVFITNKRGKSSD